VVVDTAQGVTFAHRVNLEVHTTSFRSTRGYSYSAVILDELAFFRDDLSANPDVELVRAVRPGLANLGGRLLGLSSPHSRRGHLFEMYRQHYGRPSRVLVIQAGGPTLNPTIDAEVVERARADDPIAARSEWDAQFREDISQCLEDALIDRALSPGTRSRPRQQGFRYCAFADPSGGRHDSFTIAIAHQERGGRVVLDRLLVQQPPFEPEEVTAKFAETLGAYGLRTVTGDRYSAEWVAAAFRRHAITYLPAEQDKSAIFVESLPLFAQGMVELLDSPTLETELRLLERRPRPGGRGDLVDHPPRGHDDAANAACGALVLASRQPVASVEDVGSVTHSVTEYDVLDPDRRRPRGEDPRPAWARAVMFLDLASRRGHMALVIDEYDANGRFLVRQQVNIANGLVQIGTDTVPVYATWGGKVLDPNFAVSAEFQSNTLNGGYIVISGGPAIVSFGNDPAPVRNGIPIAPGPIAMAPLGRRLAVL
jgi:hypothetical protein